jgi:hypothetical protein
MMKTLMTAVAVLGLALLGGCGWSVGASSTEQVQKPTVGQQLIDLQKAHSTGALSDAEYAKKRKEVVDAALATP